MNRLMGFIKQGFVVASIRTVRGEPVECFAKICSADAGLADV